DHRGRERDQGRPADFLAEFPRGGREGLALVLHGGVPVDLRELRVHDGDGLLVVVQAPAFDLDEDVFERPLGPGFAGAAGGGGCDAESLPASFCLAWRMMACSCWSHIAACRLLEALKPVRNFPRAASSSSCTSSVGVRAA